MNGTQTSQSLQESHWGHAAVWVLPGTFGQGISKSSACKSTWLTFQTCSFSGSNTVGSSGGSSYES
eukprot:gene13733-9717_t